MTKRLSIFTVSVLIILVGLPLLGKSKPVQLPEFLTRPGEESGRKSVMFVFGHFDDDSTIAGTINMFVRAGWEVNEVWITSAGTGGLWYGTTVERRAEMEKAVDAVGVPQANRHVLGFPDRQAVKNLPKIMDLVTELVKKYQPSVMITCAYEGGHWDHDASALAGYVASRRVDFKIARFEVPTYNRGGPKLRPYQFNTFLKSYGPTLYVQLDPEAWRVRKKVRYAYQSQWFLMMPLGLLYAVRHLEGKGELIRPTPDYDFLKPPHPGLLMVQGRIGALRGTPFSVWEQAVRSIPEFGGR